MIKTKVMNGEEVYVMGVRKIWVEVECMFMRKTVYASKDFKRRYAQHCGRLFKIYDKMAFGNWAISGDKEAAL